MRSRPMINLIGQPTPILLCRLSADIGPEDNKVTISARDYGRRTKRDHCAGRRHFRFSVGFWR
jgi:hypothetical protein